MITSEIEIKKRVLCLVIHSLQPGGMERVMAELAEYFASKQAVTVKIILYGKDPTIFYRLHSNIEVYKPERELNGIFRLKNIIGRSLFLRRVINSIMPDAILSFGEYWNSFVLISLLGLRYPIFISDRCSPEKNLGFIHSILSRTLYPLSSGYIAQTEYAAKIYNSQYRLKKIKVIGNPIRRIQSQHYSKEKVVLTVGRLIASKNHDKLIKLFCKINKPDWRLIIVGGDALNQTNRGSLEHLITELGVNEKVTITGYKENVDEFYECSSLFAFMSESEGFPNVIGEAMSAGLPVIAFDCVSGPSEMIKDSIDGFLIPPHDYSLFQEKLELLMDDEELRKSMGERARPNISKYYVENIGQQYYTFLFS